MNYEAYLQRLSLRPWGICVEEPGNKNTYRRRDDQLWKAVVEDLFEDFLDFFFPGAARDFDLERGFEQLDKEFDELCPPEDSTAGARYLDKLVKVFLKDGRENYFLIHIEVQGQKDKEDFGERMFRYWYRVKDKYKVPVAALAILTDTNKGFHPTFYRERCLGTRLNYEFDTYKVLDQQEEALRANPNPFALVILATLQMLKNGKGGDQHLLTVKRNLVREMLSRNLDRDRQRKLFNFINRVIRFKDPETERIFEQDIKQLTGRKTTMGIEEFLLEEARMEGEEKSKVKNRL